MAYIEPGCTNLGHMPRQDPDYGINWEYIAPSLALSNWKTYAVVRHDGTSYLYIWITRGERQEYYSGLKEITYHVEVSAPERNKRGSRYKREFPTVEEAIAYANGDDGGRLAAESRPANAAEYLSEQSAPWTIMIGGMQGSNRW